MSEEQPENPPVEQPEGGEEAPPQENQEGEAPPQEEGDAPAEGDAAPEGEGDAEAKEEGGEGGSQDCPGMMEMDYYDFDTVRAIKKKHRDENLAKLKAKRDAKTATLKDNMAQLAEANAAGKNIVHLEVCDFCEDYLWCTHHKQAKYWDFASLMKAAVTEKLGENWHCAVNCTEKVRLGAFEVTYNGKTMFSKLERMMWPRCGLIADKIKTEHEGGNAE